MLHSRLRVNGATHVVHAEPSATLLDVLRHHLALTGAKLVCGRGECGACTVLIDGKPVYSCLTLAAACVDREVTTIEGLAPSGELHPLQRAFIEHDATQCGFCTPGQILAAAALLATDAEPTDEDITVAMSGNLCRCGTYPKIARAIHSAAREMRDAPRG